jgi:intein/homing endonuclease
MKTYKTADEIPYDEDLPFVVWRIKEAKYTPRFSKGMIEARFFDKIEADEYAEEYSEGWVEVVDTTPKPKIPADAEVIAFVRHGDGWLYARRYGHPANKVWQFSNPVYRIEEGDLLTLIGDHDIVVLDRRAKED